MVTYDKLPDGKIGFLITVTDRGDFPKVFIFPFRTLENALALKSLDGKECELRGLATNYLEAEKMVDVICTAVTHHLTLWRQIGIPEDHSIDL